MADIPLYDRLIKGFKDGIVRVIGLAIAGVAAGYTPYGPAWRVAVFLGVVAVYWINVWLLQLAWSHFRGSPS